MTFHCKLVIWMNLKREVGTCIYKLYQQWKSVAETTVDTFPDKTTLIFLNQVIESHPGIIAISDNTFTSG